MTIHDGFQKRLFPKGPMDIRCCYPKSFKDGPLPILQQIGTIAEICGLSGHEATQRVRDDPKFIKAPHGSEGLFAIPTVNGLARMHFPEVKGNDERYREALRFLLKRFKKFQDSWSQGSFYNSMEDDCFFPKTTNTVKNVRRQLRTERFLRTIEERQAGDILVIPAQFGARHWCQNISEVYRTLRGADEFCFGMLEVMAMLLTHPGRFGDKIDAQCLDGLICAGDRILERKEKKKRVKRKAGLAPVFHRNGHDLQISVLDIINGHRQTSIPTGFLPFR